uniref:NADH dehydrogenase subunit 3 n=1 Tax=Pitambara triremiprocta TaxID=3081123 RepID=UPI002A83C27F|nr:NADH dehydrogenase subunit 3 [Pitambara triremiprocta]WOW99119.1 NADH dehydrogenase subunit 3 [Pitambara triremiprocta]
MYLILSTTLIMVMIVLTLFTVTMMISKKPKLSREKNSPFECGFAPMSNARKPFSTHFFLIATLFLIFDIEISIIIPMTFTKMININQWYQTSLLTMMILIFGLYHEWNNGMLEWSK